MELGSVFQKLFIGLGDCISLYFPSQCTPEKVVPTKTTRKLPTTHAKEVLIKTIQMYMAHQIVLKSNVFKFIKVSGIRVHYCIFRNSDVVHVF